MSEEIIDQALTEAEDALVESPTTEVTVAEQTEPAAEDTGVEQLADADEPEAEESDVDEFGPVPYKRFKPVNERAKQADQLEAQVKFYEDTLSDPVIRTAVIEAQNRKANPQGTPQVFDPTSDEAVQQYLDANPRTRGWTPDMLTELDRVGIEDRLIEKRERVTAQEQYQRVQQEAANQAGQQQIAFYNTALDDLAKTAGLVLTPEDRQAIGSDAERFVAGSVARNEAIDITQVARKAFHANKSDLLDAKQAKAQRVKQVTEQKRTLDAGRASGGKPVGQRVGPMTTEEIADQLGIV